MDPRFDPRALCLREFLWARARAHEIAVPVSTVDTSHRRPVFTGIHAANRERCDPSRVGVLPFADQAIGRVGSVDQRDCHPTAIPLLGWRRFRS